MALDWNDLERKLANEQKKCDDHIFIGGLENFIRNWAGNLKPNGPADTERITRVVETLRGYGAATPPRRNEMIARAVAAIHAPTEPATAPPRAAQARPAVRNAPPRAEPSPVDEEVAAEVELEAEDGVEVEDEEALPPPVQFRGGSGYGLDADVTRLQNVGPSHAKKLAKLGIHKIGDLLYHFPHRYDDYSQLKTISQLMFGEEVTLLLTVCECKTRQTYHGGMTVTTVLLADPTGTIQATFFNQPFLQGQFKSGRRVVISGRVEGDSGRVAFKHPEWEPLSKELLHTARIVPVYPLTEGLNNRWLRRLIYSVVEYWAPKIVDPLPAAFREKHDLIDLPAALREIHFPTVANKMQAARRRLVIEELLYFQLGIFKRRKLWREQPGRPLAVDPRLISAFVESLPFQLTRAQNRVLDEILGDLGKPEPMTRLLQGDVGSGKTIVAAAAMLAAIANGTQAALLAPTEILANQHMQTLSRIFDKPINGIHPRIHLLTGSKKNKEKEQIREQLKQGQIDIIVGTHALIQDEVEFKDLALAVVDEQHRFGVEQRLDLMSKGKGYHPNLLIMSATPIPRTLALTVFADHDLSIIDEMPPGRQEIKTKWQEPTERERVYAFIRSQVRQGRQAFVICPLIEESEAIDAKAAVEEYENLKTTVYPDLRVGLIHGKLKGAEKEAVMARFAAQEIDILVATSVVEVGIDVPNATVMLIQGADRFGLAQLHQFRGRVGRGEHQSYCLLLAKEKGATSDERLRVIETSQDGFRLAEEDLKLRGTGKLGGTDQSGTWELKIARLSDIKYLEQVRAAAHELFDPDPNLQSAEHRLIAEKVDEFWRGKGVLS